MKTNMRSFLFTLAGSMAGLFLSSAANAAIPYQDYRNGACGSLLCNINFAVIPAGKRLEVSNVSCYLRNFNALGIGDQNYAMQLLQIRANGTIGAAVTLVPQFIDSISGGPGQSVWAANHSIFAFATAGQHFQVYTELKAGSISQFACHISGRLFP